jgi:SAM-dependent methyltransferase
MDVTQRFSTRVANYIRYRPGYPAAAIDWLIATCGLHPGDTVADVGSGTGISSRLLCERGLHVLGIEPNPEMREASTRLLADQPLFEAINGTADATTLPDVAVHTVLAAQAFHWFKPAAALLEFKRIVKPGGRVTIVWNDRLTDATPFLRDYEQLLQDFATDYREIDHKNVDIAALGLPFTKRSFPNAQVFDYAGLEGRLMSSSYAPESGHPNHAPMLAELRRMFDQHAHDAQVAFLYSTDVFVCEL